jgi:ATP-dependent Clp protease protease subunit
MHYDNLTPTYANPTPVRADDDDDDEDEQENKQAKKNAAPVAMLIQKKFLEQRKIFLWGAVTDESAKDLTEKLLYLEAVAPGKEISSTSTPPAAP